MTRVLHGPFPFDPSVPQASARAALVAFAEASRAPEWRPPEAPPRRPAGLYLLVELGEGRARLCGFWISFGAWYLRLGAPGAPERVPPYVAALLDAATEAVWWRELAVSPLTGTAWRPLVVLEWPPALAARSSFPPPGLVRPPAPEEEDAAEEGRWLLRDASPRQAPRRPIVEEVTGTVELGIPAERSLVTVVRAHLQHDSSSHQGRFFVVTADRYGAEGALVPLDTWLEVGSSLAPKATPPERHTLGQALELPRGGAGYALSGWLTRSLDLWPPRPADVAQGTLGRRDVRSVRVTQAELAVGLTVAVFAPVLSLALLVRQITEPKPVEARPPEVVAPQPAISVCSADHQKFVEELRCQVGRLAAGASPEDLVCGDDGAADTSTWPDDLQPELCGVLDRARDGETLTFHRAGRRVELDAAEFAAAQACFNVLGHPEPYEQARAERDAPRRIASPEAFLHDPSLGIQPLQAIVSDVARVCDGYRSRLEARLEGAVFATHVGLPAPRSGRLEPNELRIELVDAALAEEASSSNKGCFRAGVDQGLAFSTWRGVCGEESVTTATVDGELRVIGGEPPAHESEIWERLGPEPAEAPRRGDVVERYVRARFPPTREEPPPEELWACHLDLARAASATMLPVSWDLRVGVPHVYDVNAGMVRTQLELDALLPLLRGGLDGGACWSVVTDRLARYTPVHPLGGMVDEQAAWSAEQQVCAQACATRYGLAAPAAGEWITRADDIETCVSTARPTGAFPADLGQGTLDRLVIPWFGEGSAARQPRVSDVCAFNLVAHDLLPTGDEGLLVSSVDPVAWAGETSSGSHIAGGTTGAAAIGARNLSSYGQSRSRETCANVAAQCFVSLLVEVAGDRDVERYRWPSAWAAAVEGIPGSGRNGGASPWCSLIAPHLSPTGTLPDGQFDYPCAKGVEEQRLRVADVVARAARGQLVATGGGQ